MNCTRFFVLVALLLTLAFACQPAWSQATLATGSIQGSITDPQAAVVPTAKVTVTSRDTGLKVTPTVTSGGTYNSGPLAPGEYTVQIEATGFKTVQLPITVQVGNISNGSVTLEIGAASTVITVEASAVQINTEQPTIQGVVTQEQIESLPINGRNFLDLAQLEPGVQIQDGGNFDPTKKGFASVSFGGRFGRTARIEVDGLDISDENVGTTTQNVPMNSIQEFQASQSSLDLSTELTSSGTLNVLTKSGSNVVHGGGFVGYRDNGVSDVPAVFAQRQYGANLGGALIKDKLFAFGSGERTELDLNGSVFPVDPFQDLSGSVGSPFRDQAYLGRLDYNLTSSFRVFFKFAYEQNRDVASYVPGTYQPFANVNFTPNYAGGGDFTTGSFTHSFRIGYFKFRNGIVAAPLPVGPLNPAPDISLVVGNSATSCTVSGNIWCSGLNILAPQRTIQSNKQFKYDGTKSIGSHILRYGIGVNRILGGGGADFFGLGPSVRASVSNSRQAFADTNPFGSGGRANPLNWPVHRIDVGNGEGCFTELPQFGQDCGGQYDTRFQWYVGDTWKVLPNFTLTYGLRYNRDTGRTDSDLGAIPELNAFQSGLGNPVRQPNKNFGGLVGFAWDPWKSGKTIIRAGAGVYYENAIFNNVLFDRPGRLTQGLFNQVQEICTQGGVLFMPDGSTVTSIDGLDLATQVCDDGPNFNAIGNVKQAIVDLQNLYQSATQSAGPQANGAYFGATNSTVFTGSLYGPDYRTPRSYQMNVGFQRELHPGIVVSADYLRNVDVAIPLGIDANRVGAVSSFDAGVASSAIDTTNALFSCPAGVPGVTCAIGSDTASDCAVDPVTGDPLIGAHLCDYAENGLGGGLSATGGLPQSITGTWAFGGKNQDYGQILLLRPVGRAVYNGLQVSLRTDLKTPLPFIKRLNSQVSYTLSRFDSQSQDLDFVNTALNYDNPGRFMGPGSLDRTHQLSAGVLLELPFGFRTDFITHWYTALPQNIIFHSSGNPEDIFQYDTTGSGETPTDATPIPVPGSQLGAYGRSVKAGGLNNFIEKYSSTYGNAITPAGQAVVGAGLMTPSQLQQLCAITPSLNPINNCAIPYPDLQLQLSPPGQASNAGLFTFDLSIAWSFRPVRSWERLRIEPSLKVFNLFNHSNYNDPISLLAQTLDGHPGSINGTTVADRNSGFINLIGLGSGAFAFGSQRTVEFGVKFTF